MAGISKPANAGDARKLIDICIRAKLPTKVLIASDSGATRGIVRKILSAIRYAAP